MLIKTDAVEVKCKGLTLLMNRGEVRYLLECLRDVYMFDGDTFGLVCTNVGRQTYIYLTSEDKRDFVLELQRVIEDAL
jgi:hypothetical protein